MGFWRGILQTQHHRSHGALAAQNLAGVLREGLHTTDDNQVGLEALQQRVVMIDAAPDVLGVLGLRRLRPASMHAADVIEEQLSLSHSERPQLCLQDGEVPKVGILSRSKVLMHHGVHAAQVSTRRVELAAQEQHPRSWLKLSSR